jgi:predicted O-linked N-acetylglucosamine transferase (SPINDLY family)
VAESALQKIPGMLDEARELLKAGSIFDAEKLCRAVLLLDYRQASAHHLMGCAIMRRGEFHSAADCFSDALRFDPENADAHLDRGNALFAMGRVDEAISAFQESLRLRPGSVSALGNLSVALREAGRLDESIAALEKIVELKPDWLQANATLAFTLHRAGRIKQAIPVYRKVLELKPDETEACSNLSAALSDIGQYEEACATARRAIQISANYADAWANLGDAERKAGRPQESMVALRKSVELRPGFSLAHNNMGNALRDSGQIDEAVKEFRKAIMIDPTFIAAASNLVYTLYFHEAYSPAAILAEHQEWNRRFASPLEPKNPKYSNNRSPDRQLRVGYVSADFRHHVVAANVLPLLRCRDRESFHLTCYSNVTLQDQVTARFRAESDEWRNIAGVDDAQVARMIANDRIDILVDLSLHMAGNRLLVFARRPAPVQVTFAGYPGTTGLAAIGYRLTDPYLDPCGLTDAFYSEQSIRLRDSFWCYEPSGDEPDVNELPALKKGRITFGCLNNVIKAGQGCLKMWSQVLMAVPGSSIDLLCPPGVGRDAVVTALGISPSRVRFHDYQPRQKYLGLYHEIDIGLDTYPYNGHTTSLDSWFLGVPVVSLAGPVAVSRAGLSHASNLGLAEMVARTPAEFVQVATNLAKDLDRLSRLRGELRSRMTSSPLTDANRFARNVEEAYRSIWRKWCDSPNGVGPQ